LSNPTIARTLLTLKSLARLTANGDHVEVENNVNVVLSLKSVSTRFARIFTLTVNGLDIF
jgi:hypothetical protein